MVDTALNAAGTKERAERPATVVVPQVDYLNPAGAPALYAADSIAWRVYRNPLTVMIGGVCAATLEMAEPRVRTGVWEHSIFPTNPLARVRRTSVAAMATIYAPAETSTRLIRSVTRMHSRVEGKTPEGVAFKALDEELLNWVHATVDFGFMEAYAAYGGGLSDAEKSAFYAESRVSARHFGAISKPASLEEQRRLFAEVVPTLEAHPILFEYLKITQNVGKLPPGLRWFQRLVVKAGVDLMPAEVHARLGLGPEWRMRPLERTFLKALGAVFSRVPISGSPPVQASLRLGLAKNHLYRARPVPGAQPSSSAS